MKRRLVQKVNLGLNKDVEIIYIIIRLGLELPRIKDVGSSFDENPCPGLVRYL
jgi:hypothetical protein